MGQLDVSHKDRVIVHLLRCLGARTPVKVGFERMMSLTGGTPRCVLPSGLADRFMVT